jgi:hypothetical protein
MSMPSPDQPGRDRISSAEIRKDALQDGVEATAAAVGQVATIVTSAVREVAGALGGLATDLFEIRDGARRAARDQDQPNDI